MFGKVESDKNWSSDRILVMKVMDNKKPLNSIGNTDPRLFTGENNLHAHMDRQTSLWFLRYDMGHLPPILRKKFTKFKDLLEYARAYYKTRNIEIVDVRNA